MNEVKMEVLSAREGNEKEWDNYVRGSGRATFFHQWGWKRVIENALGHEACYLMAWKRGRIRGVLPLFLIRSPFFDRFLVSAPAANYGGICADGPEAAGLLLERAKAMTADKGASYLELRDFEPAGARLSQRPAYVTVLIRLDPDPLKVWARFRQTVRTTIRKAANSGIRIETGSDNVELFYDLYSRNMRRLGSPCFGLPFFQSILTEFPDRASIILAKTGAQAVAGDLIVRFKDNVLSLYAGTEKRYLPMGVNSLITWEAIRFGCREGYRYYDFGRSVYGTGSFNFKKRWNGEIHPLCYYYHMPGGGRPPLKNPHDLPYRLASMAWRRLPLSFTRWMGPRIVKYLH